MDSGRRGLFFDASTAAANSHGNLLFLGSHDPILRDSRSFFSSEDSSKKRPFFTCSDEFVEEEYYDEQSQDKKRRLTTEQVRLLEKSFETENKLEPERKTQLANKLGLQPRQVAVWFQNRRARWKTKQLERDYDLLKASYDSLRSDFDLIVHENEKLKSEVASLSEKLQEKDASGMKVDQIPHPLIPTEANVEDFTGVELNVKAEDRLSSKSGGSAVVDDDVLQLVDSVDSYFPGSDYCDCIGPVNGVQSDGEDISEDSRNGFSEFLMQTVEHNHQEEAEALGWWVWA